MHEDHGPRKGITAVSSVVLMPELAVTQRYQPEMKPSGKRNQHTRATSVLELGYAGAA